MKTEIESYFNTENEYWNEYVFKLYNEAIEKGIFENIETPLQLFGEAISIFTDNAEKPVNAIQLFFNKVKKAKLEAPQQAFILNQLKSYLLKTEFDKDLSNIYDLLNSHLSIIKKEASPEAPRIYNLRDTLKAIIQNEIEQLPETLEALEPMQRLSVLTKLMPYVFPKVEAVHSTEGEPTSFDNW